ncbi:unnamed protein product, partial [Ectocarpus sp. 8 AP-2014]
VGFIITRLFGIVNLNLEDLPFEEVLLELKAAPRPHTLEFLRYDMNFNRLTLNSCWKIGPTRKPETEMCVRARPRMETPLMVAAKRGSTVSVRWLLQRDAKMDVLDRARRTPLMHAILSKSEVMAALFMDYSVALRATDVQWGWTALHCAAHVGMVKVVENLLGKRASPYAESKIGQTPLDVARRARQIKTTALLEAFLRAEPAHEVIAEAGANV